MYISRVRLTNVRGFSGARAVDLEFAARADGSRAGWTVIAGRNGSGKTTLLRAMSLALCGPSVAHSLVPDFDNWITAGEFEAEASAEVLRERPFDRVGPQRRQTGLEVPPSEASAEEPPATAVLRWERQQVDSPGLRPALAAAASSKAVRSGLWNENPVGWFHASYGPFRRLAGGSGEAQRLMLSPGAGRSASLFHEDASLAEGVRWLIDQHLRSLERKPGAEKLKRIALSILGDGLLPDGYRIRGVDSDGLWVEHKGHRFPLREMSDGYRTVAALAVDLIKQLHISFGDRLPYDEAGSTPRISAPGVVIIDEVDAHLHVSWQQRIGIWLKQHFPQIQFIVTSHSPYICQAADPGGLIRLPGPDEQEPPRVVDQDLYERIVYGTGDDAVMSELFGLDQPYSEKAARLRRELGDLEIRVLSGEASPDEVARYTRLQEQLTSSPASAARDAARRFSKNRA
ncbi:ATP-binding protein [Catellatospora sp. TT07R-123]|uniref:AAA family ATPase n=1 Tax=Catellatospora sp. TT07R-123 TaxID=2733863 RepID=UPI001B116AB4|nr:ATP-binding protein [Catellatospora sp. TT07R-123]GHJ50220.1 ATP-binding protein [Catellatospora sp. TT07R-123]